MAKSGKKLVKVLGILGLVLVAGVVILVVVTLGAIDTVARKAIEAGGSYATGVDTTVASTDISIMGGTFQMTGFDIGNPEGFTSPHFLGMQETRVALSVGSLTQENIRLPELTLREIDVYLEGSGQNANYNQILNNLKRFESGDKPKKAGKEDGGSGKTFVIDVLTIDGVEVNVAGIPGIAQAVGDVTVNVPKIELNGVGSQGGLSMAELIDLIVKTVLSATIEAGGGIIPADVLNELGSGLAGLESLGDLGITAIGDVGAMAGEIGEEATKVIEGAADEAGKAIDDAAKGIEEGLNDLLGGGTKKDNDGGD